MEWDLRLAAAVDMPVLISGPPAASRDIACELDRRSRSPRGAVEVVDCRQKEAVAKFRSQAQRRALSSDERARILLLQEIHALSPEDQVLLARQLEQVHRIRAEGPVRILASSSVPLFDRVVDHLFDERLFYRLNVIHIVVPPEGWSTRPVGD